MNNCPQGSKNRTDWLDLLNKESGQKADNGDGEAMHIKYLSSGQSGTSLASAATGRILLMPLPYMIFRLT
jgi:hypothetical protein